MTQQYEQGDDPQKTLGDRLPLQHRPCPLPPLRATPQPITGRAPPHPTSFHIRPVPSFHPTPSFPPSTINIIQSLSPRHIHPCPDTAQSHPSPHSIHAPVTSSSCPSPCPAKLNISPHLFLLTPLHPNNSSPITHTHLSPPHPCSPLTPLFYTCPSPSQH